MYILKIFKKHYQYDHLAILIKQSVIINLPQKFGICFLSKAFLTVLPSRIVWPLLYLNGRTKLAIERREKINVNFHLKGHALIIGDPCIRTFAFS